MLPLSRITLNKGYFLKSIMINTHILIPFVLTILYQYRMYLPSVEIYY